MPWQTNVPRGDLLPLNERPRFTDNWNYIETELQDDHFWNEDGNHDGHHRKAEMTNIADTGVTLDAVDLVNPAGLSPSVEGMFYVRPKSATEAPAKQITEPYFMSLDGATRIINQLGFRCLAVWDGSSDIDP